MHQETKLLTPTSATEWRLYLLHVRVLWGHFSSAANLVWWRSVPVPCVTHWGAQVTPRSRISRHCPLRSTQKAAFILGLTLQEWFYSLAHTSRNPAGLRPLFFFFFFLMETLTYVRQRNYCSLKLVLVTSQGPARGQRVTQSLWVQPWRSTARRGSRREPAHPAPARAARTPHL